MLQIKLSRTGAKKRPFYHLQVAERRGKRDGRFVEQLGFYNPVSRGQTNWLKVDLERVDYWLSVGAKPTETVARLIKYARRGHAVVPATTDERIAAASRTVSAEEEATSDSGAPNPGGPGPGGREPDPSNAVRSAG